MDLVEVMYLFRELYQEALRWGLVAMVGIAIAFIIITIIERKN